MKKILLSLSIVLLLCNVCYGAATEENGDTRAKPMSLYGTESDDSITAIRVDSDGKVELSGNITELSVAEDLTVNGAMFFADGTSLTTGSSYSYIAESGTTVGITNDLTIGNDVTITGAINTTTANVGTNLKVNAAGQFAYGTAPSTYACRIKEDSAIELIDKTSNDVLMTMGASSDDGVLDIYQNNFLTIKLNGGGDSYISNALGLSDTTPDAKLDVNGDAIIEQSLTLNDAFYIGANYVDAIIDDDTMATADANNLATAESIKEYVDNNAGSAYSYIEEVGTTVGITNDLTTGGDLYVHGDMCEYAYLTMSSAGMSNPSAGQEVEFSSMLEGNMTFNSTTHQLSLSGNNTYVIRGVAGCAFSSGASAVFKWYDVTNNRWLPNGIETYNLPVTAAGNYNPYVDAFCVYTPPSDIDIELRIQSETDLSNIFGGDYYTFAYVYTLRRIKE